MKKSSVFLWSYALFLLIVPIICLLTSDQEAMSKVCTGATIAGYFFAFADLTQYMSDVGHQSAEIKVKIAAGVNRMLTSANAIIEVVEESPILSKKAETVGSDLNTALSRIKTIKAKYEKNNTANDSRIIRSEKSAKSFSILSRILCGFGFFFFLAICIFGEIYLELEKSINTYAILAFAVIVATYASKEHFSTHNKEYVEQLELFTSRQDECEDYIKLIKEKVEKAGIEEATP